MDSKSKFCCEKHVDLAFDDFLIENEAFPDFGEDTTSQCSYCTEKSKYILREYILDGTNIENP